MLRAWRQLWKSLGFRIAFFYAVLLAITVTTALSILYVQTVGVMYQRMTHRVGSSISQMSAVFASGGVPSVAREIAHSLADGFNSDSELFLLLDAGGHKVAGNLAPLANAPAPGGTGVRQVRRGDEEVKAYLASQRLPDGSVLLVGQDLREQTELESLVGSASAAAVFVALVLLIAGTVIFRQELDRSVADLRRTAASFGAGDLRQRVDISGARDELTLLHRDINAMLDRIESLVDGVRHVSDTIAHNLRTPLTRIRWQLGKAQDTSIAHEQRQDAIRAAVGEIDNVIATFEKLLQIAQLEAGAWHRSFSAVSLGVIADDVLELYEAVAESRGITLLREPAHPVDLAGDKDLLAGVVANLVDNALKYAGSGAVVRLGTTCIGTDAVLTVQDNGPGIPPEECARMGTRFHRLQPLSPGHGLGLASVRAVVGLHRGHISFADSGPGLRVEIHLPLATS